MNQLNNVSINKIVEVIKIKNYCTNLCKDIWDVVLNLLPNVLHVLESEEFAYKALSGTDVIFKDENGIIHETLTKYDEYYLNFPVGTNEIGFSNIIPGYPFYIWLEDPGWYGQESLHTKEKSVEFLSFLYREMRKCLVQNS